MIGRPNVGKSTLLNRLIGTKVSISSSKAQTTRYRLNGILTEGAYQFVFVDTPGFQIRYRSKLNAQMNQSVREALKDVDCIVVLLEAGKYNEYDDNVIKLLPQNKPVIAVINKVDVLPDKGLVLPQIEALSRRFDFAAIIPISAERDWQVNTLKSTLTQYLPESPFMFEEDDLTDRDDRFFAAEFIREKIFRLSGDEVPYSTHVVIDSFKTEKTLRVIEAKVMVEREGQRAMLLGHEGSVMKRIATEARQDMERLWGCRVHLTVRVLVRAGWMNDPKVLRQFDISA